jgi:ribosome-associated translation inhibitor RaiA
MRIAYARGEPKGELPGLGILGDGHEMSLMSATRRAKTRARTAMPSRLPKATKKSAGRTETEQTPAAIRTMGVALDPAMRGYIRERLGRKLGKFAPSLERVTVRLEDVNGPRGGVDKECRIKAVLSGQDSVIVEERGRDTREVVDRAADRIERAVRKSIGKTRTHASETVRGAAPGRTRRASGARRMGRTRAVG